MAGWYDNWRNRQGQMRFKTIAALQGVAIMGATALAHLSLRGHEWTWLNTLGAVIVATSFPLWLAARIQLGGSFSVRAKAKQLVTHGIYSKIRNPIYIFGTATVAGFVLLINRPVLLLLLLLLVPMQVARARKEAKVLEEAFGVAYREYRRKTWF